MIKEAIAILNKREDLDDSMVEQVMGEIMTDEATDAQKAAFLTALSMKGETISEITTAAKYLRDHCEHFENDKDVLEIVGTGGDGSNTINISTIASIIVSAGGVTVAKHGNRAASSKCGTADCLEALGVKIDVDADKMKEVMGTKVSIASKGNGKGKIEIEYYSDEELERMFDMIMSIGKEE